MGFETYYSQRYNHLVVGVAPDLSMRVPVGFAVIMPKKPQDDESIERTIDDLQKRVYAFPEGLVADLLNEEEQSPEFALALSSRLNDGNDKGMVNFVYFPGKNFKKLNGSIPQAIFNVGIVSTRGYEGSDLQSELTMLHRGGHPVLGVEYSDEHRQVISNQTRIVDLSKIVIREFAGALSMAIGLCLLPDQKGNGYTSIAVNPIHAFKPPCYRV